MEFTGKIIWIGEKRQGTSVKGTQWSCREYVIQDASTQYPRTMCFTIFGEDKLNQFNIQLDETLTVSFDIDAHQYQDRWYNSIQHSKSYHKHHSSHSSLTICHSKALNRVGAQP